MNIDHLLNTNCLEWLKYSDYEFVANKNGELYIKPTANATLLSYDPKPFLVDMMIEATNIGHASKNNLINNIEIKSRIINFVKNYGLLGLINAFIETGNYNSSDPLSINSEHINKFNKNAGTPNYFDINEQKYSIKKKDYVKHFSYFGKFENAKNDPNVVHLVDLVERNYYYYFIFSKEYSEKFDWILSCFINLSEKLTHALTFHDNLEYAGVPREKRVHIEIFNIDSLSFAIKMFDLPTLVWKFSSLKLAIDTVFGFYLSDKTNPLRICKHCKKIFIANLAKTEFCSPQCRNQFNVYKSREKTKTNNVTSFTLSN